MAVSHDLSIPQWDHLPEIPWASKIAYLTYKFLELPQTECPVEHLFEEGRYIREMKIPARTLFLGRVHRYGHEVELLSGKVVWIRPGGKIELEAPFKVHTNPGDQMVAYILTDVVCRSVHPNKDESRDVEALELDAFHPVDELKTLGLQVSQKLESGKWLE